MAKIARNYAKNSQVWEMLFEQLGGYFKLVVK